MFLRVLIFFIPLSGAEDEPRFSWMQNRHCTWRLSLFFKLYFPWMLSSELIWLLL